MVFGRQRIRKGLGKMILNMVFFNLKDDQHINQIQEDAVKLLNPIEGVRNLTFRRTVGDDKYRYGLFIDFDSKEIHKQYLAHENHVRFAEECFIPFVSEFLVEVMDRK